MQLLYYVYKIKLERTANVTKFSGSMSYPAIPVVALNGKVVFQYQIGSTSSSGHTYLADEKLCEIHKSGVSCLYYISYGTGSYNTAYATPAFTPVRNHELIYYITYNSQTSINCFIYLSCYLAINNLTGLVTKYNDIKKDLYEYLLEKNSKK